MQRQEIDGGAWLAGNPLEVKMSWEEDEGDENELSNFGICQEDNGY